MYTIEEIGVVNITQYKVVLHVSENDRFEPALRNIKNSLNLDEDILISLILNGEPAKFTTTDKRLTEISSQGVEVVVCQNSLNNFNISEKDLLKGITIVPASIFELIKRQYSGWAYIKP